MVDPVCAFHGIPWSQHEGGRCLYCCSCFKTLTPQDCWVDEVGQKWDMCEECGDAEDVIRKALEPMEKLREIATAGAPGLNANMAMLLADMAREIYRYSSTKGYFSQHNADLLLKRFNALVEGLES